MRLVILDRTLEETKLIKGDEGRCARGEVMGRVRDTASEGHIFVAALPTSASRADGRYHSIGRWAVCELSSRTMPSGDDGLEIFISPDSDDLLAFYKGRRIDDIRVANYRTDFTARIAGIVDCGMLAEKTVFIIGAGSVGSQMAMHLVRVGVGKFAIVDFDTVEAPNLCRCEYSVGDIGRYKTLALRDKLQGVNPGCQVETYELNVMDMDDEELLGIIQKSDLVISAADTPAAEHRLNALAHSLVPVIYPSLYSRASGGEVIFTVPGGPCYQCVVGDLRSAPEAPSRGEWDYTTAGDLKAEPGLGIDISHAVVIASKVALGLLLADVAGSDAAKIIDRGKTIALVSNGIREMYGISFEPLGITWAETEVNADCVVCKTRKDNHDDLLARVRAMVADATAPGVSEAGNNRKTDERSMSHGSNEKRPDTNAGAGRCPRPAGA